MRTLKLAIFYLLSFSWGLPMTIVGLLAALAGALAGGRVRAYRGCVQVELGERWGGISLGLVFFTQRGADERLKSHERGHCLQNCVYGPLMPILVGLPSLIRSKWRKARSKRGHPPSTPYDAIWFERQATAWGARFC